MRSWKYSYMCRVGFHYGITASLAARKERLYFSLCSVVGLSIQLSVMAGHNPPPHPLPETWFLGSSSNFKQLLFSPKICLIQKNFTWGCLFGLGGTYHCSVHPVVCLWPNPLPLPETWFLGSSGNFKQLSFSENSFFFQNFFLPKIFFHLQNNFPSFSFYAFLDVLCYPECSKILSPKIFIHPKFVWVKQGATQCYQAFLVWKLTKPQW